MKLTNWNCFNKTDAHCLWSSHDDAIQGGCYFGGDTQALLSFLSEDSQNNFVEQSEPIGKTFTQEIVGANYSQPVWLRSCALNLDGWQKSLPQILQENGRSPVCMRSCIFRFQEWWKLFSQNRHWYGRSPVCMRSWRIKFEDWQKPLLQNLQTKGRSPVWMCSCTFKFDGREKPLPQRRQTWRFRAAAVELRFADSVLVDMPSAEDIGW